MKTTKAVYKSHLSIAKPMMSMLKSRLFWQRALKIIFFAFLMLVFLSGCAQKVVYKEVFLPQKCLVSFKPRPIYTGDFDKDTTALLIYTELLEADLKLCRGTE